MENEIRLSSNEFRALASKTRASIIKLLKERNHTLTEMSKKLQLAAPTVKQHLGVLEGAELIQEMDEGRKWKYYSLTRKGKDIFSPETPVNVLIVLGITVVALVGMLYSFISMVGMQATAYAVTSLPRGPAFIGEAEEVVAPATGADAATKQVADGTVWVVSETTVQGMPLEMQAAFIVAIAAIALIAGYLLGRMRK